MPETPITEPAVPSQAHALEGDAALAVDACFAVHRTAFLNDVLDQMAKLNPREKSTLVAAIDALTKAGIEQKEIALKLGVSRTTVSRWAVGEKPPRAPAYTEAMVLNLMTIMTKIAAAQKESDAIAPSATSAATHADASQTAPVQSPSGSSVPPSAHRPFATAPINGRRVTLGNG